MALFNVRVYGILLNEDKQLLVSDEIYWIYDETEYEVKPITIKTSSLTFKTGVVNKVIQYTFEFDFGQTYKLVI